MVTKKNVIEDVISDHFIKMIVDASGLAFCIYSNKPVSYGSFVKKIF